MICFLKELLLLLNLCFSMGFNLLDSFLYYNHHREEYLFLNKLSLLLLKNFQSYACCIKVSFQILAHFAFLLTFSLWLQFIVLIAHVSLPCMHLYLEQKMILNFCYIYHLFNFKICFLRDFINLEGVFDAMVIVFNMGKSIFFIHSYRAIYRFLFLIFISYYDL
jgi:hypothetical protein